jgi:hypothetical protein
VRTFVIDVVSLLDSSGSERLGGIGSRGLLGALVAEIVRGER